jgi:ATP-dependent DNA ligase
MQFAGDDMGGGNLPRSVKPQLCALVDEPPQGPEWLHEERLRGLLSNAGSPLQYSDHQIGRGPEFQARACELSLEGIISKRANARRRASVAVLQWQPNKPARIRVRA